MKKSLVMAMAMAMGVTASAYAANPFSDVPAGHWAYDAVAQLAAAGVVDGYGTTFGGEKLMTRYEMAQIVAKAMAKGANTDKLAAEFADELDALGVRVAKLEKKVDNVKITGNIRYSYAGHGGDADQTGASAGASQYNRFRTRLFVNGAINDNWSYTGMLENDRMLNSMTYTDKAGVEQSYRDGDKINLKRAFLTGRLGGVKLNVGRVYLVQNDMLDANSDGIEAKYSFGKFNLTGWMARNVDCALYYATKAQYDSTKSVATLENANDDARVYMAKVDTKIGAVGAFAQYWAIDANDKANARKGNIWEIGLDVPVAKDMTLAANYYRGSLQDQDDYARNGYEFALKYRGAKAAKPGTWGAWLVYDNRPVSTFIKPTSWNTYAYKSTKWYAVDGNDGYKGIEIGANVTLAKNIVGTVRYFDYNGRTDVGSNASEKVRTWWGDVTFTF